MSLIVLCMKPFSLLVPDCDSVALVGNGFCNDETNNADCNYDGGECCGPDISCKWPCFFHGKIWIQTNSPILDNAKDSVCLPSLQRKSFDYKLPFWKNNHKLSTRLRIPGLLDCYLLELVFKWIKCNLNFSWKFAKYIYNTM